MNSLGLIIYGSSGKITQKNPKNFSKDVTIEQVLSLTNF